MDQYEGRGGICCEGEGCIFYGEYKGVGCVKAVLGKKKLLFKL